MLQVGQKVGLKRPYTGLYRETAIKLGLTPPEYGVVYTVSAKWEHLGETMIDLLELPQPGTDGLHPGYRASGFRPVKTTSIDVFTAMLAPEPNAPARRKVKERVDV